MNMLIFHLPFSLKKFFFNIDSILKDKERQSTSRGGAERDGDIGSEAGSRLCDVSTECDAGLELTDQEVTTCAEV